MADPTEEQLKAAARKALAAGDNAAAKRLIAAARKAGAKAAGGQSTAMTDGMAKLSGMSRNPAVADGGDVNAALGITGRRADDPNAEPYSTPRDTNTLEDMVKAGAAGVVRGVTGLADLPGKAVTGFGDLAASGLEGAGIIGPDVASGIRASMAMTPMGGGSTAGDAAAIATEGGSDYRGKTTAGEYAGAVGEFLPGALAGPGGIASNIVRQGVIPALASEAAGQMTEGTALEPFARIVGAVVGGVAGAKINVPKIGTPQWRNANGAATAKPSLESLRAEKNLAYKAVDDAGEVFDPAAMTALRDAVKAELDAGNYVSGVDKQTDAVVALLDRKAGTEMTLGQLDKLRQEFYKRLAAAPNEVGIRDAIDQIDTMIAGKASTNDLMAAARLSNSRYKKAELLDLAFQKAKDQTAATGSGGNINNKFRQAVVSIIDNPKNAKWFAKEEIDVMRQFVAGSRGQNALRLAGKLSPNGNGLMLALNMLGAAGTGGMSLIATGAAMGAKEIADRAAVTGADALVGKMAGGIAAPVARTSMPASAAVIPGVSAAATVDYEPLWQRYGK